MKMIRLSSFCKICIFIVSLSIPGMQVFSLSLPGIDFSTNDEKYIKEHYNKPNSNSKEEPKKEENNNNDIPNNPEENFRPPELFGPENQGKNFPNDIRRTFDHENGSPKGPPKR